MARETCFKLVFEYEFLNAINELSLEEYLQDDNLQDDDKDYITESYKGIVEHNLEIVQLIKQNLKAYTIDRIYKVDLAILKLAIYELKFSNNQVPSNVVINEAVELAKKYSTDKSYSFVNGILASILNGETNAKSDN